MTDAKSTTRTRAPAALDMRKGVEERDPTSAEATARARALGRTTARDFRGFHRCRGGTGDECGGACRAVCRACPICAYNVSCGDGCTDAIWCWCGVPVPALSCVTAFALDEDDGSGAFVARDKQRQKSCAFVPLDRETGRYAVYVAHCRGCGTEFRDDSEPACVAEVWPLAGG